MGTAYGSQLSFRTLAGGPPCPGIPTVTDVDNNTYNTVQIGTQCWAQSNLKVSKYRNGDNIPTGLSDSAWFTTTSGAYAIYDNDPVNESLFGKLYNHCAVMDNRGLCPTGWHVPSSVEWTTLFNNLGVIGIAGGALKSTATLPTPGGWHYPNSHATNSSGFTALPGGYRFEGGDFMGMALYGNWWSTSFPAGSPPSTCGQPWAIARNTEMNSANTVVYQHIAVRTNGFSVRCLKD